MNSILFLTNAYPDFDSSYRGIFIKKMASFLQRDGYEISVVTPKIYKGSKYFEDQKGIKVYRFPFFSGNKLLIEHNKIPYLRMILYYITGFFFTLYALIRHQCQLIHVHWAIPTGLIGALIADLLRKPLIVTIHGSDFRLAMDKSSFLRNIFLCVCKRARHLHCVSGLMKKEIERLGIGGGKMSTFPMGVDGAFFEAGKNRKSVSNGRPLTIFSNRNLLAIYNVSLLLRAIPMVLKEEPKVRFLIAGDGPERGNLEKEANELNTSSTVQFLGRIPHEEMPALLSQADIYVSTSLFDGTSISLLEAMACGAFPIVTEIPPNREWIINEQNGFLFSPHDEGALARKIVEAVQHPELLREACEKNQKVIEKSAHWKYIISRLAEIYEGHLVRTTQ
jgi:glycosyltransferase involved in cell wall biosynthesis